MIKAENISKEFKIYHSPTDRLKEILLHRNLHRSFHALKDVTFEVGTGETLGIVGQNGAGKSTLLKILTGVLMADSGHIHVDGKITGLLELGTGFNMEFTGIQNIYLNGILLGMSREEVDEKLEEITAFTELQEFIYEPLKTYSSGMVMRLAFSTAIHADPQAFVVDEALSVGDAYFQQKCMRRIREFKAQGGSIVFVSHDMNAIKILCDSALLLDHGVVVEAGDPDKVINTYNFFLAKKAKGEEIRVVDSADTAKNYGNFKIEITDARILDHNGQEAEVFISGKMCTIEMDLRANESVDQLTAGILIRDRFGQDIFGTNTYHMHVPISLKAGESCTVKYVIREFDLGPGKYTLSPALHKEDVHLNECYQWIDAMRSFEVVHNHDLFFIGISKLKPTVCWEKR